MGRPAAVTGVMIRAGTSSGVFHIPLTPAGAFIVANSSGSWPCHTAHGPCTRYHSNSRTSSGFPAIMRCPKPPSRCQVRYSEMSTDTAATPA